MQLEHVIIAALLTGSVTFWIGFFTRKAGEQPAYSRVETDAMQESIRIRLDGIDARLERIELKVDRFFQREG